MKRRVCYAVLLDNGDIAEIAKWFQKKQINTVYAFVELFRLKEPCCFPFESAGHHLIEVGKTCCKQVIDVNRIKEKSSYLGLKYVQLIVCRMPDLYGLGVIN